MIGYHYTCALSGTYNGNTHGSAGGYIYIMHVYYCMVGTPAGGGQTDTPVDGGQVDTPAGGGQADTPTGAVALAMDAHACDAGEGGHGGSPNAEAGKAHQQLVM
jgi:hypothetical protein